ncbi:sphinganine C4-monooxygenase 2-like [Triticum dicoccoides]|uniref:sphinganine C4-monooxygenase 2-like n=1 Tax=Triticum dicoccoides TaxID=85692 RepID=UPI00188F69DE|nr:sphinganine C4-monooxygenase 2-like [Triticum dicoccoides]
MELVFSDEALAIVVPIAAYWVCSSMYMALGRSMDEYRLHPRDEERSKNLVSKRDVVKGVVLQQLVQAAVAAIIFTLTGGSTATAAGTQQGTTCRTCVTVVLQVTVGKAVLDGWQYAWHRYMHRNKFMYRHVHSWHHRLVLPYAFGVQYNHPVEGLLDTVGGALAFLASGMSSRVSIFFFMLCAIKGVDAHCGLWLPGNPRAGRYNFSQPFFVTWDKVFGTHMPYVVEHRPQGGLHVRPMEALS